MGARVQKHSRGPIALLVTALGIVYGDIGTSPLYALREAFYGPHALSPSPENIYGVLSLITWVLIFVISIKYLQIVLRADNKGEGGVLALTALAAMQKDKKLFGQKFFLRMGLFGAALLVGDSIITPAISVLSAVEGLKIAAPSLDTWVLPITFAILIALFSLQKEGTARIGRLFGPVMMVWFFTLAVLGVYSISRYPEVLQALNPQYAILFWLNNPGVAFIGMGAVFLVVTGGEALYTDLGHLGRKAISRGWFFVALPSLILNYFGQGAALMRDMGTVVNPFYLMAPPWATIPLLVISTFAAVIASQAVISGLFSMASQCVQLGYAPRLKIVHTSEEAQGQIYVPVINWMALVGTIWLVIEFRTSSSLASAYGITISITMVITTILTAIVARHTWGWSWQKLIAIFLSFLAIDFVFLGANLFKIADGGWVPLLIAGFFFVLMTTWKKGRTILFDRLRAKSYPFDLLQTDLAKSRPARVPGAAIFMVGDADVTPPTLLHNIKHNKVLHETVVFLTFVGEDTAFVSEEERAQIRELAPGFYRVTAHFGFSETPDVSNILEKCEKLLPSFSADEPTFFLGREILVAGRGVELAFWRKTLFCVMARNAESANIYFKLPIERVIEVGMQIEL